LAIAAYSSSPLSDIIEVINEQGEALRLHFDAVVAAVELPVARGKLKLRIKTFLGNSLCRGVDGLCTKQLESRKVSQRPIRGFPGRIPRMSSFLRRLHEVQFREPGVLNGELRAEEGKRQAGEGELQARLPVGLLE
jgi:hypothetical protein